MKNRPTIITSREVMGLAIPMKIVATRTRKLLKTSPPLGPSLLAVTPTIRPPMVPPTFIIDVVRPQRRFKVLVSMYDPYELW